MNIKQEELYQYCYDGNLQEVQRMIEVEKAKLNSDEGYAIRVAAANGHLPLVRYLADSGANLNLHAFGNTALTQAAEDGHLEVVKFLLDRGADINAHDQKVLLSAANYGQPEIVDYLLIERDMEVTPSTRSKLEQNQHFVALSTLDKREQSRMSFEQATFALKVNPEDFNLASTCAEKFGLKALAHMSRESHGYNYLTLARLAIRHEQQQGNTTGNTSMVDKQLLESFRVDSNSTTFDLDTLRSRLVNALKFQEVGKQITSGMAPAKGKGRDMS
ncbi:ankyrin repeat domain-containing protein [Diaphorobacter aerolatus]|uniref:Ankyrin repeat domain-containing protein n=1 Tax=Diaphorobacter aerolatus TaxID=1288495 RepID=A0A7H0GJA8_9BURK|nr:ankyrin repeat domain-containing protein [Diaphorobacter aerolatus]QNP48374.1 ankyrin repeat domain-containing protein [Diaphorobacter aerolatus]